MNLPLDAIARDVMQLIRNTRCDLSREKQTQADLATALERAGVDCKREVRLAPGEILDLLVEDRLAIEVKLRGHSKREVFKQLERYARHDRVEGLMLVTNLSMGLPPTIESKPVWYQSLGMAWL